MKVQVNGKTISLTNRDFLASGGEGLVYVKDGFAHKVYSDRTKAISLKKIKELSALSHPNIIKPEFPIVNRKRIIGYAMRYVRDVHPLCRLFTKSFKSRHNLTSAMCLDLVKNMQETIHHVHENDILIVDLNEQNFLADTKFEKVLFIDVDSYQTPHFPATAIMESIRDRHNTVFTKGTDWFSFAVVSFQLLVGIHPYRGKHPKFKGLDARMEQNISVLHKDVRVPKSCMPFNTIPRDYLDWYTAVFNEGLREEPPSGIGAIAPVPEAIHIRSTDALEIAELFKTKWPIFLYVKRLGMEIVGGRGACLNRTTYHNAKPLCVGFGVGFLESTPVALDIKEGVAQVTNLRTLKNLRCTVPAESFVINRGDIYVKYGENISHLVCVGPANNAIVGSKLISKVSRLSTQTFPGLFLQDLLGSYYATIFLQTGHCAQERLKFLDGYKVTSAKYENGVLIAVGSKKGVYDRFVYSVANKEVRITKDIDNHEVNFTVLDNGLCVAFDDQDRFEIFHNADVSKMKVIEDPHPVCKDMPLFTDGVKVLVANHDRLCSVTMK